MTSTASRGTRRSEEIHLPPQDLVAERSVLGCILMHSSTFDEVADRLHASHFYSDVHGIIYAAIQRMHDVQVGIDVVTLAEELQRTGKLDDVGGPPYLAEILEAVPHAGHIKYHAKIVYDKWIRRSLTSVCTTTLRDCYEGPDTSQLLETAEQGIFGILESRETKKNIRIGDLLPGTLSRINDRIGQGAISGLSTGFRDLDHQTNGFQHGELIILAARPSMGKTAFVCNIAEWCSDAGKTPTLLFSLEQSQEELTERFLCIRSRLDGHRLRKGLLDEVDRFALLEASRELDSLPLFIDDQPGRTITQISAICRRMKRRNNIGLVIIDYLQLIEPEDKRANREQQIAQITRRLKAIAKENRVPIIALSQLNREVDKREDKRPRLSDLRESGAIEQDADIVVFLHRPEAYREDDQPGLAEVIVAKHRSGPTGLVNLRWRRESMRFTDYEPDTPNF